MIEPPAVRHEGAVAYRMERAALVAGGINRRPHSLNDEQVVLRNVVDNAAFDVGDTLGDVLLDQQEMVGRVAVSDKPDDEPSETVSAGG